MCNIFTTPLGYPLNSVVTYFVMVVAVVDCVHIQPAKSQPLTTVLDM